MADLTADKVDNIVVTRLWTSSAQMAYKTVTECHPGLVSCTLMARTIIDIGGQDSKVIKLDQHGKGN